MQNTEDGQRVGYLREVFEGVLLDDDLRVLLPVFVAVFMLREVYTQALPLLFESLGISLAVLGVLKSLSSAVDVVLSPISGALADEGGRMTVAAVAAVAVGVLSLGYLFADTRLQLGILIVTFGVATMFLFNAVTPAVNAALDDGIEGAGWGIRDVSMYLGSGVGLAGASYVLSRTEQVSVVVALLAPVAFVVAGFIWTQTSDRSLRTALSEVDADLLGSFALRDRLSAVSDRSLLAKFCAVELFTTLGAGMSLYLLPAFATEVGIGAALYFLVYSGSRVFGAPASLAGGVLADHVPKKYLYVGNFAIEAVMLVVFGFAVDQTLFYVGIVMFVAQTTFEPGVIAYFFENFDDEEAGTIWGIKGSVSRAVQIAAPSLGGVIYAFQPRLTFLVGGVFMGVGSVVALTLPRSHA